MKRIFLVIIPLAVCLTLFTAVFINIATSKGKIEAIAKVKSTQTSAFPNYPDKPGKVKGIIRGGGVAPGIQIPGEFETKVKYKLDGTYQVTFTEYWSSKDFKYHGSKDGRQSFFQIYEVRSNNVKFIKSGGNFSPHAVK